MIALSASETIGYFFIGFLIGMIPPIMMAIRVRSNRRNKI